MKYYFRILFSHDTDSKRVVCLRSHTLIKMFAYSRRNNETNVLLVRLLSLRKRLRIRNPNNHESSRRRAKQDLNSEVGDFFYEFIAGKEDVDARLNEMKEESPGVFCVLIKKENDDIVSVRDIKQTKSLKSSLRECVNNEQSGLGIFYSELEIGARKKVLKECEDRFRERFHVEDKDYDDEKSSSSLFTCEHVRRLREDGYVVIDEVVSKETVENVRKQAEVLASRLFSPEQEGRDDDMCSIKIDVENVDNNKGALPLNAAGAFLWSIPFILSEMSRGKKNEHRSEDVVIIPECVLNALKRAEEKSLEKYAQLAKYDKIGAKYDAHVDFDPNNEDGPEGARISERNMTSILYLNNEYDKSKDGGCLRIFKNSSGHDNNDDDFEDIEPIGGRLVIFDARRILHGVLPSFKRRWALTVWN